MTQDTWGWSDQLVLDYALMDVPHRAIVESCVALSNATPATCLDKLDTLITLIAAHFAEENQWMRVFRFPSAGCHISEHETALGVLRDVRQRVHDGDTEPVARLMQELPKWFVLHVVTLDAALAGFLCGIGFDGNPLDDESAEAQAE